MASLQDLKRYIFHERQEKGSMLCAQHALNSLLQQPYFSAPDLSDIGRSLDYLESGVTDDAIGNTSTNMDDTGFFSVQVLEKALQVFGLTLVRWRSEQMRPYQDHPERQLAFILNQHQHWYTLRRFGDITSNSGQGHWFNLDSSIDQPDWLSKTYLKMFLQSAEQEGYSIFAVTAVDPEQSLEMLRTDADEIAMAIPDDATNMPGTYGGGASSSTRRNSDFKDLHGVEGLEDEDMELQAALQASMWGSENPGSSSTTYYPPTRPTRQTSEPQPLTSTFHPLNTPIRASTTSAGTSEAPRAPARTQTRYTSTHVYDDPIDDNDDDNNSDSDSEIQDHPPHAHFPGHFAPPFPPVSSLFHQPGLRSPLAAAAPLDAVEASRRRGQAMMDAFTRQQQAALQFTHEEEQMNMGAGLGPRRRRTRAEQEEDDLRRAIEESRLLAEAQNQNQEQGGTSRGTTDSPIEVDGDDDEDDDDYVVPTPPRHQFGQRSFEENRVYDDDDAELQAALKASLETVPEGFRLPSTPPRATVSLAGSMNPDPNPTSTSSTSSSSSSSNSTSSTSGPTTAIPPLTHSTSDTSETDTEDFETESEWDADTTPAPEPAKPVDVAEMRRMRLARFGGS